MPMLELSLVSKADPIIIGSASGWSRLGEIYFFINSNGELYPEKELNNKIDNMRWKIGNYFSTENEAQKYADEFKRILQGRTLDKEE